MFMGWGTVVSRMADGRGLIVSQLSDDKPTAEKHLVKIGFNPSKSHGKSLKSLGFYPGIQRYLYPAH